MFTALVAALQAVPVIADAIKNLVSAYQAHVKLMWAQSLQAGLQPLENGTANDAQKAAAAKAVADAISKLGS